MALSESILRSIILYKNVDISDYVFQQFEKSPLNI